MHADEKQHFAHAIVFNERPVSLGFGADRATASLKAL
jgi:hypothetical protein